MLRTHQLEASIAFYRDVLGFTVGDQVEGWAVLTLDGVEVMLASPNAHEPFDKPAFTGSLYLRVADVDAVWEKVRGNAAVVYPIADFDYGMREFAIRDNNGYTLQFGQEIG